MLHDVANRTDYRRVVAVLSVGQIVNWAALYYAFSSFVLPMQQALGWSKPVLMGAFTLGLTVWGLSTVPAGAAFDRGYGRHVLAGGSPRWEESVSCCGRTSTRPGCSMQPGACLALRWR